MLVAVDNLSIQVAASIAANAAAVAAIQKLVAGGADPVQVQALVDSLKASTDSLVAATPAA